MPCNNISIKKTLIWNLNAEILSSEILNTLFLRKSQGDLRKGKSKEESM